MEKYDMADGVGNGVDDGWLDAWVGRGRAPGGSGAVQVVVTGLPDGDASWQVRVDDGVVVEVAPGAPASSDLTLTLPAAVAAAIADGDLAPSAAFMQGRMKTAGDNGLVLDVLAAVDARA
jgi:putative sterol carrier protein